MRDRAACASLREEERDELARLGRTITLRRGETLFSGGDNETGCARLISGALKISSFDADGTERILSLVHPAGMLGITIETVSRQLTQLEDDGAIRREGRRGLVIRDPAALEALAA